MNRLEYIFPVRTNQAWPALILKDQQWPVRAPWTTSECPGDRATGIQHFVPFIPLDHLDWHDWHYRRSSLLCLVALRATPTTDQLPRARRVFFLPHGQPFWLPTSGKSSSISHQSIMVISTVDVSGVNQT